MTLSLDLRPEPASVRLGTLLHCDRILFGTDDWPSFQAWATYARLLETRDEYFLHSSDPVPGQGRCMTYGLHLPQDHLHATYHDDAARLFGLRAADSSRHQTAPTNSHEGTDETP